MDQKLFEEIRGKFDYLKECELQRIWKDNDREEYSEAELETVRQLLRVRNAEVPEQDRFEGEEDGVDSQEAVNGLLKGAMVFLLIFGAVNVVYWIFAGGTERAALAARFGEVKPILWVMMNGQALVGGMLVIMSLLCAIQRDNVMILVFSGSVLIFSGLWNMLSELLMVPAFAEYGVVIPVFKAFDDFKYFVFVLGVLELRWGFNQIRDYFRVRKYEREHKPSGGYMNVPR